ncbi:CCA tRNA nucleotidyltransferase [Aquabacter spiritensis]|uniref:Poly(A) polymerase n=1 Tax=Aquabacter spiritensis TaxID=933073 RepID=A0A4R3LUU1_9HYPH|nr:CCA tRNA nucleotidyltransferase [Aquabacter spiritensis]TCT02167.1 poly(A) polymerase [Aquabacter spiritensis]
MTSLAGAAFLAEPRLARVLDVLNGEGEETRIVGGAVRNALIGAPVDEVDLATTAMPAEVVRRAAAAGLKAVPTGIAHGTVTVVADGRPLEVTTLREDVATDGRHAIVRFGRDWARDAARRDFTMNALYATREGAVIDLVGGRDDLAARRVRFIGDPDQRIREDYLRILRLFRFHAAYGRGPLDPAACAAAIRNRAGIAGLSRERVRAEILKLLAAPGAPAMVETLSETGFLDRILAGIGDLPALRRLAAWEHAEGVPADAVLRLGILAVRVPEDADRLRVRLRLSGPEHARLTALGAGPIAPDLPPSALRALLYRAGAGAIRDRVALAVARGAPPPDAARRAMLQTWVKPVLPVRAADLQACGVAPGPALGAALKRAEAAWIAADFPADPAAVPDLIAHALGDAARRD